MDEQNKNFKTINQIKCQKCGTLNNIDNKQCFYCNNQLDLSNIVTKEVKNTTVTQQIKCPYCFNMNDMGHIRCSFCGKTLIIEEPKIDNNMIKNDSAEEIIYDDTPFMKSVPVILTIALLLFIRAIEFHLAFFIVAVIMCFIKKTHNFGARVIKTYVVGFLLSGLVFLILLGLCTMGLV